MSRCLEFLTAFALGTLVAIFGFATTGSSSQLRAPKVVLVFDPGGPIGAYAHEVVGLQRAVRQFGVTGRVVTLSPKEDWTTALSTLAAQRYDLIIRIGAFRIGALDTAARAFPNTRFAVVDGPVEALRHRPTNVMGTVFREEQAGYLAGYLAGLVETRRSGKDVISSVGGIKYFAVDAFIAGYQSGARKADPRITTLNAYSNSFVDRAKCRAVALNQIAKGSSVVFNVAGACGLGALEAAKQHGVWGIGVDKDQSSLGPYILTSAIKGVGGIATFEVIRAFATGKFLGGHNLVFDVRNGGVGLGKISPRVPTSFVVRVERIRRRIASGMIRIPTTLSR
jgi:basic membrane protein A and related proteins